MADDTEFEFVSFYIMSDQIVLQYEKYTSSNCETGSGGADGIVTFSAKS